MNRSSIQYPLSSMLCKMDFGIGSRRKKTESDVSSIADAIIGELIMNSTCDDNSLFYF